jgi:hypothetical protein
MQFQKNIFYLLKSPLPAAATSIYSFYACENTHGSDGNSILLCLVNAGCYCLGFLGQSDTP